MGIPQTIRTPQSYAVELSPGVLPGSPVIRSLGPNDVGQFSPAVTMVARQPVGSTMEEVGAVVDLVADGQLDMDLIGDHFDAFVQGALRCALTGPLKTAPTSATAAHFVVPAGPVLPQDTLVIVRGSPTPANNGFKVVGGGSTATQIVISGGLTAEVFTPAQGVTVEVCGFRFGAGDLQVNAGGNLITTTKDLTQLGLVMGQTCWLGGDAAANHAFATAANRGPFRIGAAPTASLIVAESKTLPWVLDAGAGKTIDLYFGQTARVVPITDPNYVEPSYQFETPFSKNGPADVDTYEYAIGRAVNTCTVTMPAQQKATMSVAFIGMSNEGPTVTRKTGWNAPIRQTQVAMFNTVSHIMRGRIRKLDGTALTGYITSANLTIGTGAQRNPAHGVLGSIQTTFGVTTVAVETNSYFSHPDVIAALVAGDVVAADWLLRNGDGAIAFDLPCVQLGGGQRNFPAGQLVTVDLTVGGRRDPIHNSPLIISRFPYLPAA